MHIGFGLYKHMLNREHYRFARQCGATHAVVHLVDYFAANSTLNDQPIGGAQGWGYTSGDKQPWSLDALLQLKEELNREGLIFHAIENFDPAHWFDILLDGPKKYEQVAFLKEIIRNVGKAGIPVFGYNFSIAGVAARTEGPFARGEAVSVGMIGEVDQRPIPRGMVWNMQYDATPADGVLENFSHDALWERLAWFLREIIPVAEESNVIMAAHPDDPPAPFVRSSPRLVYQPALYKRLLDLVPSDHNRLEYCLGSISEMTEGDIYEYTDQFAASNKIGYIHFRNVKGKVPFYREVFIDEGDIDMIRILKILKSHNYTGVLIPDHTPKMSSPAPWHSGMAFAMGYMKAALDLISKS